MNKDKSLTLRLLYSLSLIASTILPLVIWRFKLPIIEATYDGSAPKTLDTQPFELFGFFIIIVLVATTWTKVTQQSKRTVVTLLPAVLPLLTCLSLLFIQIETFHESFLHPYV